jgi:hypothetical protein
MRAVSRSHQQLTAFGSFPESFHYKCVSKGPAYPAASRTVASKSFGTSQLRNTISCNTMKLMKKQPSTSYVAQATAATGGITNSDVANHGDFLRLQSRSMAVTSNHKVGSITQVSFCTNSRERLRSPQHGLEKHRELREPHSGFNVEEGAHNRSNWNTAHLIRKCQGVMAMVATRSPDTSVQSMTRSSECE